MLLMREVKMKAKIIKKVLTSKAARNKAQLTKIALANADGEAFSWS